MDVRIKVRASKKYNPEFVKDIEESVKDIVEGRVGEYEELAREFHVKVKKPVKV